MQDFKNTVLRDARRIVGSPADYIDDPDQFAAAWAAMKAGRGQGFDPARLHPQHLVDRPGPAPEPTEQILARAGQKARAVIEAKSLPIRRRHVA
ncbi:MULTISPECIES: hypothetical protein [Rhodobacterales]|uniref:hypothetical protein n=1 Tax=Rhodobacterales TaxID=204455 RepID=UPI00237FCE7F|nr:hypothetical protein [Phaeobacter gallaeciensis]MEE2634111.1 hypothetical protein [Pseudomonadota bacterium]MDE4191259.1 hypothetical protein [Phaeobacter gallaeciensis]MDE4199724.1 hypothetical protein [Phaeobacter gallaeciensis]MDE4203872.1 hypothetical protein [Phaeobacter gallaeciensis]MDE4208014.1 hypothetical protein [Phaeobacter gallaeciensis]